MAVLTWDNGSEALFFDVTLSEGNTSTSKLAEFPIEKGAKVNDHVFTNLSDVTLSVFVSNSPLHQGRPSVTEVTILKVSPLPVSTKITAKKYDRLPGPTPGAVVSKLVSVVGDALFGDGPDYKVPGRKFSRTQGSVKFASLSRTVNGDRRIELVDKLEKLRTDITRIDVFTAVSYYPDCVITSIEYKRDKSGDGLRIDLTFGRIREVETQSVPAPKTRVSRAKAPQTKGKQGEDSKANQVKSLFRKLAESVTGG